MKIRVVSTCHNEAQMMPFYLRHYETFADEIEIFDDASTDGTVDIIAGSSAKLRHCPFSGLDDDKIIHLFQTEKDRAAQDGIDWFIVPDIDEILFPPQGLRTVLENATDYDIIFAKGWHMCGESFPLDDGRQIWDICSKGVPAKSYSKPIVCRPSASFTWVPGRHGICINHPLPRHSPFMFHLLHYRLFGNCHTERVNIRNFQRRAIAFNTPFTGVPSDFIVSPQLAHESSSVAVDIISLPFV